MKELRIDDHQRSPMNKNKNKNKMTKKDKKKKEKKFRDTTASERTKDSPPPERRRLQRRQSQSSMSMSVILTENIKKPETPLGWIAFLSSISSALILHEIRLQKKLTCPPLVYAQKSPMMDNLLHKLSHVRVRNSNSDSNSNSSSNSSSNSNINNNNNSNCDTKSSDGKGILTRDVKPSLFVGTRSIIASSAAYALHGPHDRHVKFREVMTMTDGATIALDWEFPHPKYNSSLDVRLSEHQLKANVKYGPIDQPVVIILHGINNDTSFGYMKSLMRSCSDKGWIACGMNFRGCGGVKLTTPRGYNAGYTGDLRTLIQSVSSRLKHGTDTPVFVVGNSLGANVALKYLGEEGFSGTLPKCVKGGITLGNPLHIHSGNVPWPFGHLLGAGIKKTFLQNWSALHDMSSCFHFGSALRKVFMTGTVGQLDNAMSPFLVRNDSQYPFQQSIGFKDGEDYWHDSSSNRYVQHVPVPLLQLESQDDFLVTKNALQSIGKCLENPNVLICKTKCGGHLGWQEAPPDGFGVGKSWADLALTDFIDAVLDTEEAKTKMKMKMKMDVIHNKNQGGNTNTGVKDMSSMDVVEDMYASRYRLQSKL
jgi:predicted alpha/beta-fold hydrolase